MTNRPTITYNGYMIEPYVKGDIKPSHRGNLLELRTDTPSNELIRIFNSHLNVFHVSSLSDLKGILGSLNQDKEKERLIFNLCDYTKIYYGTLR